MDRDWWGVIVLLIAVGIGWHYWHQNSEASEIGTLSQQRMCADQATKFFDQTNQPGGTFINHYVPSQNKCFIQITTTSNSYYGGDLLMGTQQGIYDAFEGMSYATYADTFDVKTGERIVDDCSAVATDGKMHDCKTGDEWASLTRQYRR